MLWLEIVHNSLPNDKILDLSKFKALADDRINATKKLKFVLGMVENILGKGYQHFLLFPKCFQKPYCAGLIIHSHTMIPFDAPGKQAFWKHSGKRRNCWWRAISPFPKVFSTRLDNFLPFSSNLKLSSAKSLSLEESKICRLVMGKRSGVCGKGLNCLCSDICIKFVLFSTTKQPLLFMWNLLGLWNKAY